MAAAIIDIVVQHVRDHLIGSKLFEHQRISYASVAAGGLLRMYARDCTNLHPSQIWCTVAGLRVDAHDVKTDARSAMRVDHLVSIARNLVNHAQASQTRLI